MPEIATHADDAQLKEMWNTIFKEEPSFLETFFSERYHPHDVVLIRDGETIASCLHALPCSFQGNPCRYIVGAATWPRYRRHGMMGSLLSFARAHFGVPLVLYPEETARAMYAKNGFLSQTLWKYEITPTEGMPLPFFEANAATLEDIYRTTSLALDRDSLSWRFFLDEFRHGGAMIDGAYALVHGNTAVETGYVDTHALFRLIKVLASHGVTSMILFRKEDLPFPVRPIEGGMYDQPGLKTVFVGEQY